MRFPDSNPEALLSLPGHIPVIHDIVFFPFDIIAG